MIFLGVGGGGALGGGVPFAADLVKTYAFDLSAWPPWAVVAAGTLLLVLAIWITMKVLKWTLWLLLFFVLIGGVLWSLWLLLG